MYKETFVSPNGQPTREAALKVLEEIRATHIGWLEIDAYVEKKADGWHAVRVHEKP